MKNTVPPPTVVKHIFSTEPVGTTTTPFLFGANAQLQVEDEYPKGTGTFKFAPPSLRFIPHRFHTAESL
jgi:hypothetical protein